MASSEQDRAELDARAKEGETVVPGGTGGGSLEAQQHIAQGRSRGGQKGGQTRKEQVGTTVGYKDDMGRKGRGGERAEEEDDSKFRTGI